MQSAVDSVYMYGSFVQVESVLVKVKVTYF